MGPRIPEYMICIGRADAFFDGGRTPIPIPGRVAAKSGLLRELRENTEAASGAVLPVPLAYREIIAWLKVAEAVTRSPDIDPKIARKVWSDTTLGHALKAATFLQDDETTAVAAQGLAKAISLLPAGGPYASVTDADRTQARKIVDSVPQDTVPGILAAALRHSSASRLKSHATVPLHHCRIAFTLLQLLPPAFHAAVMHAYCVWRGSGDTLVVHNLPRCERTACAARHLENLESRIRNLVRERRRGGLRRDDAPLCASATFQLLAAAAPLAGGDCERSWELPGICGITAQSGARTNWRRGACASPVCGPAAASAGDSSACAASAVKRRRMTEHTGSRHLHEQAAETGGDHAYVGTVRSVWADCERPAETGQLTALDVKLSFGVQQEPERWCNALAQLRSLRRLTVAVPDADMLSSEELVIALQQLPCLDTLSIDCVGDRIYSHMFESQTVLPFDSCSMGVLYKGICELQQLSSLSLKGRQHVESVMPVRDPKATKASRADEVIHGISRLTRLTCMQFQCNVFGQRGTGVLARTLAQMPTLRAVRADLLRCFSDDLTSWEEGVLAFVNMLTAPSLTCLESFGLGGVSLGTLTWTGLPLEQLHQRISERNEGLLSRLTSLHLPNAFVSGAQWASLLAATPSLESLCLAQNVLEDSGLLAVAGVLPRLPGLTSLDISSNNATDEGVFAILRALLAREGADVGLRDLNICSTAINQSRGEELASLLQQFSCLEQCGLADLGLFCALAWFAVSEALEALPKLRFLYKGCDVERADVFANATVQESLRTALGMLQKQLLCVDEGSTRPYEPKLAIVAMTWAHCTQLYPPQQLFDA